MPPPKPPTRPAYKPIPYLGPADLAYHRVPANFAALVHEVQGNAGDPSDGFEARFSLVSATVATLPHVISALGSHAAEAAAAETAFDLDSGSDVDDAIDQGFKNLENTERGIDAAEAGVWAIQKAIASTPNAACTCGPWMAPPKPAPTPQPGAAVESALWKIAIGGQALSVPLQASAAAWSGGSGLGGASFGGQLAAFLPVVSAVALGALLPLEILKVFFGIDPFSSAASDAEIAQVKQYADTALTSLVGEMGNALKYAKPGAAPPETVQRSYDFALGFLTNATCYVLSYTDPREYQWSADWLTQIAQTWVKALGTYPPPVTCPGH